MQTTEMHSGLVGITLANTPLQGSRHITFIRPNDQLKEAELRLDEVVRKVFSEFCKIYAQKERTAALISFADIPKKNVPVFNAIHTLVKKDYTAKQYLNSNYPFPADADNIYAIPSSMQKELNDFSAEFTEKYSDYFRLYNPARGVIFLEPKYQTYLEMGNVEEFAKILNNSFADTKTMRKVALEKIALFKMMAYKESEDNLLPAIDPQEVPRIRQRLFEMFKYCEDYDVRKTSLIELNDLIETDSLTSENLGEIVTLHRDMEDFLKDNAEKIQGKLIHMVIETYAKILSLILLYSPKQSENTIILDEDTKKITKSRLDDLSKLNISGDREAEYWRLYARNCLDLLNTTKSEEDKWLEIAGAFAMSTLEVAATIKFSPSNLVDALDKSYNRIKIALQDNISTMPYWLPPVVMINRFCQKTMNSHVDFKKIIPTLRKFKHISIQEVRYGIIVILERVALKTRFVPIEIDAMKLLMQYINIHDETIAYRLLKAFGRILKYRQKIELSNTAYLLLTLIEETKALFGDSNKAKLRTKLLKFRKEHPHIDKPSSLTFHSYLIKYFLKERGFIDDFGGRPTGFLAISSLHSNNIKFQTNHANILRRIDQIVKITEVDVYGNTLYHAAVWNKNFEMIPAVKSSGLKVDIAAQEYEEGNSALHLAINLECEQSTEALLKEEAKGLLKIKNRKGNTPLHLAAISSPIVLSTLLKYKPELSPVNKEGQTPIAIAIEKDNPKNAAEIMKEMVKCNLQYDVNIALEQAITMHKLKETQGAKYETLKSLLLAAGRIDYTIALKIILMMADEKCQMSCSEDFARFHADNLLKNPGYQESFKPFESYPQPRLAGGKIPKKSAVLSGGWPKKQTLSITDHIKNLESNQEKNFDTPRISQLNMTDEYGNTALFYAAYYAKLTPFIPKVVSCGCSVNHLNQIGLAPLHIAVIRGNAEAVIELLEAGADINLETGSHNKFTPLHFAAYLLQTEIVKILLAHAADPNKQSHYGDTALSLACLFRLEKNSRVPDISFVKDFDASPNSSPVVKPLSLKDLRSAVATHNLTIDESAFEKEDLEKLYTLLLNIFSLKKSILELDNAASNDLNQILETMREDFKITLPAIESYEKRLRLIYILITLFKLPTTEIGTKDFFGNNILHLSAMHCCPTIPKIICYYQPDLFWKDNFDQLLPIECAQNDPQRVFALFNALNINYVSLDWSGHNGDVEKNAYIKRMADQFDSRTALRLPLRHILAKANLFTLFERLVRLDPERATKQDHSFFKQTSLHVAARWGHEKILDICIEIEKEGKVSFLKARDHFNNTAGHIAIIKSQPGFAKKFIQFGGESVKAKNDDGRTMLHLAAIRGQIDMVDTLLKMGADPFEPDAHGDIPLHLACFHAHPGLVSFLLKTHPKSIELLDEEGRGPLHHACMMFFKTGQTKFVMGLSKADCEDEERNSPAVIKILRDKLTDLDPIDSSGATPLMIASANGYEESVSILLGNDNGNKHPVDVKELEINQRNALHLATIGRHLEVVKLLLIHDRTFNHLRQTPLFAAQDINNETPLLSLAKNLTPKDDGEDVVQIFKTFAESGADLMEADENGSTLLHWACYNGRAALTAYLLSNKNANHLLGKNNQGDTPLHHAACMGHIDCVKLLINHGAKSDPQNNEGVIPLMLSVKKPPKEEVPPLIPEEKKDPMELPAYFLSLGFDLTTVDNQARNFLHYFLQDRTELNEKENKLLTDAIRRNPKLIRKSDKIEGNTPLHIAGRHGNADALEVVLKNYPYRDILVIMRKTNDHDWDAQRMFKEHKPVVQAGKPSFSDLWLTVKPDEIIASRPRGIREIFSRNSLHRHHHKHHLRKIIPRGDRAMDIAVPPPGRSKSSFFDCFRSRRVRVVIPDDRSID